MTIFYVDTNYGTANDNNNGLTLTTPLKTISRGVVLAQPGDTVYVRAGTYREQLAVYKSGSAGLPITIENYNNEIVTVKGTALLTGWTQHSGNIYKTTLPSTMNIAARPYGNNQIFINGVPVPEARFPYVGLNKRHEDLTINDGAITSAGSNNTTGITNHTVIPGTYTSSRLSEIENINLVGSAITLIPGHQWTPVSGVITARTGTTITFNYKSFAGDAYKLGANNWFYLYNNYDFLLQGGNQFYHNIATNELFLWDGQNRNPSSLTVEYKNRDQLIDIFNRSYINIKGINFFGGRITSGTSTSNCKIQNCTFDYGNHCLYYDQHFTFIACVLALNGTNNLVENCTVTNSSFGGISVKANSIVRNCIVTNVGVGGSKTAAISIEGSSVQAYNNVLNRCGHSVLLNMSGTGINDIDVYNNDISDGGLWCTDEGLVLVARRVGGALPVLIHHNKIYNGLGKADGTLSLFGTTGIYIDGLTSNIDVYRNLIYNTTGSTISLVTTADLLTMSVDIINNTCLGEMFMQPASETTHNLTGTRIINNLLHKFRSTNFRSDYILRNNVTTNVQYVEARAFYYPDPKLNSDYTLLADSPLIDKGEVVTPFTDGYNGNLPDIGAFESLFGTADTLTGAGNNSFIYIYNFNLLNSLSGPTKCKTFVEWEDTALANKTISRNTKFVTYTLIKTNNINLTNSIVTITLTDLNSKINLTKSNLLVSYQSPYMISISCYWNPTIWNSLNITTTYQINYVVNLQLADNTQSNIETGSFYLTN